jgi:Family of unknown function (DUF5343)
MAQTEEEVIDSAAGSGTPAAYLPFRTFLSAIDSLEHGIPKQIDRTIWRSQSGIVQGQIMIALRFFCLLDDEDKPTPALHRFVDGKDKRAEHVRALLRHAYRDIIDRDLTKMTPKMLDEAMEQYSVTGETKKKAVRFFLQAARFAELPMHPLLSGQIRNTSGRKPRRKAPQRENGASAEDSAARIEPPVGQTQRDVTTVDLKSGGKLTLVINVNLVTLSSEDRQFVFALIDKFKEYPKVLEATKSK